MEEPKISKELIEAFRPIMEMNNARFRQVKTMLAGFIALQERDLNYMDEYMDTIFDFIDPQSETEELMRRYYDYIATFDAEEAKARNESLDEDLGYRTKIVFAAGLVAKDLHKGQTDKGGHDYFNSHLLNVATSGSDWKEKVVGFLHDVAEDTPTDTTEVLTLLDKKIGEITSTDEEVWWEDWMEDILPCAGEITYPLTDEERVEIIRALNLLNHHAATSREEYINRLSKHRLALKVKMHDLENNMDLTRIPKPTAKDFARVERYKREYEFLLNALHNGIVSQNH